MGGVEIKGTLFLPDKEKLWLIELTDVNINFGLPLYLREKN